MAETPRPTEEVAHEIAAKIQENSKTPAGASSAPNPAGFFSAGSLTILLNVLRPWIVSLIQEALTAQAPQNVSPKTTS